MKRNSMLRFFPVIVICIAFALLSAALIGQHFYGSYAQNESSVTILPADSLQKAAEEDGTAECLFLYNSQEANSALAEEDARALFEQLHVTADFVDLSAEPLPSPEGYEKIVTALMEYDILGEGAYEIMDWVSGGGGIMVYFPPQGDTFFRALGAQMGIRESGWEMYEIPGLRFRSDLMLGGLGKDYTIEEPYESALTLDLSSECTVHMVSADERELPVLWEYPHGEGRVVFMNFGIMGKAYRGIYAAAYSLLSEAFCWPVINGSAFYLDDFPSPVPSGTSAYIERDYGISVSDFYSNIWWPQLQELAEEYGIRYSGMVIEDYSDGLEAPFRRNLNTQRFRYFGSALLKSGGEIGLHGYNHIPLCREGFDAGFGDGYAQGTYERLFDYDYWETKEDMGASLEELISFTQELYPGITPQVYVPPSNILSEEARRMIAEDFPQIRAVASIYFEGDVEYTQEFEVAQDGVVETPRVISGLIIDSFMEIAALSELNLHYVNSHFQHPDDVLDADRGAEMGWEAMKNRLSEYLDWLYTSAPDIRNLTASEMAGAVQRYDSLDVELSATGEEIVLDLSGLQDEAFLFLRINERPPADPETCISGGTLQDLGGGLYLVTASENRIVIERG